MSWLTGEKVEIEIGSIKDIKDQVERHIGSLWEQPLTLNNVLAEYFVVGMQERLFSQRRGCRIIDPGTTLL